jgi:hypothetical protein
MQAVVRLARCPWSLYAVWKARSHLPAAGRHSKFN